MKYPSPRRCPFSVGVFSPVEYRHGHLIRRSRFPLFPAPAFFAGRVVVLLSRPGVFPPGFSFPLPRIQPGPQWASTLFSTFYRLLFSSLVKESSLFLPSCTPSSAFYVVAPRNTMTPCPLFPGLRSIYFRFLREGCFFFLKSRRPKLARGLPRNAPPRLVC